MNSELIDSIYQRQRPEDVAALCLEALDETLNRDERKLLTTAAQGALKNREIWTYTSMSQIFAPVSPVSARDDFETVKRLFPNIEVPASESRGDVASLERFVRELNAVLGKTFGENDFANSRLPHQKRRELGLTVSRRQYNKMFRYVAYMEEKIATLYLESRKSEFARIGKSKLAFRIDREELEKDLESTCFIAYYTARCNMRSIFTNGSQVKPFDEICEMLFKRCEHSDHANWWAIAFVFPDERVLSHLSDEQKGQLLNIWFGILSDIGSLLRSVWNSSSFDRERMVVRKGNDSTTWNNTASAWNRARDAYFAVVSALGMDAIFDEICFGKVPRLMAADVAHWHFRTGGKIHPDTQVWAQLPFPWEVTSGEKQCTRALVETVCLSCRVDPEKNAWTMPRRAAKPVRFTPTPELVHGVEVGNPVLAKVLRRAGFFSGKAKGINPVEKAGLN